MKGIFNPGHTDSLAVAKALLGCVCCTWIVTGNCFEEEIFNLTLLPSTLCCGNAHTGWF